MVEGNLARKLAVIVHADIVGSTLLVQQDDRLAHERMQAAFRRFSATIEDYGGHAREIRGDALVAEFDRASDAVTAALAFQLANVEFNEALDDDLRPQLRIGISLGEVIIADNTITGAGVVLAQRLEQLAAADAVVVQGAVSEAVPAQLPFRFGALGEQHLKGFEEPVRAFVAELAVAAKLPAPEKNPESMPQTGQAQRGSRKTLITVLAFECKGDPEFGEGMANDLAMFLGRFGDFSVTVRSSAEGVDEVQYVLEGRVQHAGARIRISVQLSQGKPGPLIWGERYTRESVDLFDVQDEIVEMICASVAHKVDSVESGRNLESGDRQLTAYDYYIKGREIFFTRTRAANAESMRLVLKAISMDESLSRAQGFIAFILVQSYRHGWTDNPQAALDQAHEYALLALKLDPYDFASHWRIGGVYLFHRQFDKAMAEYEKARDINRYHAGFLAEMTTALIFVERYDEALQQIQQAIAINPEHPEWFLGQLGWVLYESGRYDEAILAFERMNAPSMIFLPIIAATLVRLERLDEARSVISDLLTQDPDFRLDSFQFWPYQNEARRIALADDLKATELFD
jgi:adenylate cyclase